MRIWAALVALSTAGTLCGQQSPIQLSLAEAKRLALQNNPSVAAAQFSAAAAHQVPRKEQAGFSPVVSGNVTGVGADSGSRIAAGGLNNPSLFSRVASGVVATQLLMDFGRTRNLVGSAELSAQAQDQASEAVRADVLLATARAYFAVLRANAVLKVAQQTVAARQLVSDQATALFQSQLKSQLDVSFANVNLADAQLLVSQAQSDVFAAEAALANEIGQPAHTDFSLREEELPDPLPDQPDKLIQQALEDRPELKEFRLEKDAAEQYVKAEHALNYPAISAAGAAGLAPVGDGAIASHYGAAGLNVSIPIWNGRLFRAREVEAQMKAQAAARHFADLSNRVIRDVRIAYLNCKTSFERIGLTQQLLQQAQLSLQLAQGRYDLGLGSIVELTQAQLNVTSAQIANTSAQYEYQTQRAGLDYQTGTLH